MDYDSILLNPFIFDTQQIEIDRVNPNLWINNNQSTNDITPKPSEEDREPDDHRDTSLLSNTINDNNNNNKVTIKKDKRRRNTEASARFRIKKKIREKELENKVHEMTTKSNLLEDRIKELEFEANWLRNLLMEKEQFDGISFL